jgi:hypothetical protein
MEGQARSALLVRGSALLVARSARNQQVSPSKILLIICAKGGRPRPASASDMIKAFSLVFFGLLLGPFGSFWILLLGPLALFLALSTQ